MSSQQLILSLFVLGFILSSALALRCDDVTRNQSSPVIEVFNSSQPILKYMKLNQDIYIDVHIRVLCHVTHPTWLVLSSRDTKVARVMDASRVPLHVVNDTPEVVLSTSGDRAPEELVYNVSAPVGEFQIIRIRIESYRIGKSELQIHLEAEDGSMTSLQHVQNTQCLLLVLRPNQKLDLVFTVIVSVLGFIYSVSIGSKIDLQVVKAVLKKPVAPIIGFCCQFLIMPTVAYGVTQLMNLRGGLALGLFLVGCSPGGGASNIFAYLLNGDLDLSVCMTCISSLAALGMLPLWIYMLGQKFLRDSPIRIPYENMVITLGVLLLAMGIGLVIRYKKPTWATFLNKIIKPMFVVFLLFIFTFGLYVNLPVFRLIDGWIILAGALLPYTGFLLGGLVALVLRRPWYQVYTIAIETGIQNGGIAFLILKYSLPQPDSDLAIVAPAAAMIMTPLPIWLAYAVYELRKRCCVPRGRCGCPPCCDRPADDVSVDMIKGQEGKMEERDSFLPEIVNGKKPLTSDQNGNAGDAPV